MPKPHPREFRDDVVAVADVLDQLLELRAVGEAVVRALFAVDEDAVALSDGGELSIGVLVEGRDANVGDALSRVFHHV